MGTEKERLVYTVREVQQLLQLSRGTTYERIADGTIPSIKIGARILVPKAELEKFLSGRAAQKDEARKS